MFGDNIASFQNCKFCFTERHRDTRLPISHISPLTRTHLSARLAGVSDTALSSDESYPAVVIVIGEMCLINGKMM
jgi:hypothetical protein